MALSSFTEFKILHRHNLLFNVPVFLCGAKILMHELGKREKTKLVVNHVAIVGITDHFYFYYFNRINKIIATKATVLTHSVARFNHKTTLAKVSICAPIMSG